MSTINYELADMHQCPTCEEMVNSNFTHCTYCESRLETTYELEAEICDRNLTESESLYAIRYKNDKNHLYIWNPEQHNFFRIFISHLDFCWITEIQGKTKDLLKEIFARDFKNVYKLNVLDILNIEI
jgi:hypothetical protein